MYCSVSRNVCVWHHRHDAEAYRSYPNYSADLQRILSHFPPLRLTIHCCASTSFISRAGHMMLMMILDHHTDVECRYDSIHGHSTRIPATIYPLTSDWISSVRRHLRYRQCLHNTTPRLSIATRLYRKDTACAFPAAVGWRQTERECTTLLRCVSILHAL